MCIRNEIFYLFHDMNLFVSNKIFKQSHLYTLFIQGISTFFVDQISTFRVFRKVHFMLASKFSAVYHLL